MLSARVSSAPPALLVKCDRELSPHLSEPNVAHAFVIFAFLSFDISFSNSKAQSFCVGHLFAFLHLHTCTPCTHFRLMHALHSPCCTHDHPMCTRCHLSRKIFPPFYFFHRIAHVSTRRTYGLVCTVCLLYSDVSLRSYVNVSGGCGFYPLAKALVFIFALRQNPFAY